MTTSATTTQAIKSLCQVAENLVNPEKIEEVTEVPYNPEKCSAKSAAAMLGIAIPEISRLAGHPVLSMGGVASVWVGTHYEPIQEHDLKKIVRAFAKASELLRPNILTSDFSREFDRSFLLHAQPDYVFRGQDRRKGIAFLDGLLTFVGEKSRFIPGHRPEDLSTFCIPGFYKHNNECQMWDNFMQEAIPDEESRKYVLAMFGNAIAGDPLNAQKILLLIGAAGAGKSTMIEAIVRCIGSHNVMRTDNLAQITRDDSRHRMRLAHATMCVSADASENIGDKDALKMIVSKEPIIARKLYSEPVEIRPRASLVVASNEMGLSYVLSDQGINRRFDIVTFKRAKKEKDRDSFLQDKLSSQESIAGIGASLAKALVEKVESSQGVVSRPDEMASELKRLATEGDPFMSWMEASGITTDELVKNTIEVHQDKAHESFKSYCANHGYNPWSIRRFKQRLRALNLEEIGKHGGKHSYVFFCRDMNLAKSSRVMTLV